jgi:hypothetical protein
MRDAADKTRKRLLVHLFFTAEVKENTHTRAVGDGIPLVVSELYVADDGAVLIGAGGSSYVHIYTIARVCHNMQVFNI